MAEIYKVVYREFKGAGGGGADGHVVGLTGSINPRCVDIILTWMQVNGKAVLDFNMGKQSWESSPRRLLDSSGGPGGRAVGRVGGREGGV
jgi:hypothetical protein